MLQLKCGLKLSSYIMTLKNAEGVDRNKNLIFLKMFFDQE